MTLKDGGKRVEHANGALKEPSDGRGRYDLIPTRSLKRLAIKYELGCKKYSPRNWEGGIDYGSHFDSMKRHLDQWWNRENDEDHLAAVAWHAFALMHHEDLKREDIDNRPIYE